MKTKSRFNLFKTTLVKSWKYCSTELHKEFSKLHRENLCEPLRKYFVKLCGITNPDKFQIFGLPTSDFKLYNHENK